MTTETSPFPILVVDDEGLITKTNDAARRRFGLVTGRPCADVVNLCDNEHRRVCRYGCAHSLLADGSEVQDVRGTRNGEPWRVLCNDMGDDVTVMMMPMGAKPRPGEHLTAREQEVLQLVAHGYTARRIAQRLTLSPSTVRTHVEHIRDKLGCRTRAEAVARALGLGLLEDA